MDKTDLGDRMKAYEKVYRQQLPVKQYYIIRVDGKAFHSYTKDCKGPFDHDLMRAMQQTMLFLCENIQGAQFGYTQSDEITIVFTDLQNQNTQLWFDGNIQKITSISASMATAMFNNLRISQTPKLAMFDSRVFSVSQRYEVLNNLYWRQRDASKNSIQMLARTLFSHNSLQGLNGSQLQDKMMLEKSVNWNDLQVMEKRGVACYRVSDKWVIDLDIPIFNKDWKWFEGKIL